MAAELALRLAVTAYLSYFQWSRFCNAQTYPPENIAKVNCTDSLLHEVSLKQNQTFTLLCPHDVWDPVPPDHWDKVCVGKGATCSADTAVSYVGLFPLTKDWKWVDPSGANQSSRKWRTPEESKWLNAWPTVFSVGCKNKKESSLCVVDVTVKQGSAQALAAGILGAALAVSGILSAV
ncbi:surface antigen 2 [Cystoisospora suis]|uniref:Surface antigen 2 n=1 Tax=Cystoisospora suis TaxID=483139 RepID=A0A2C6L4I6_9APIC|nr:surface antigen 2 [Cystoisospora suis]